MRTFKALPLWTVHGLSQPITLVCRAIAANCRRAVSLQLNKDRAIGPLLKVTVPIKPVSAVGPRECRVRVMVWLNAFNAED